MLAASPVSLVLLLAPNSAPGTAQLSVTANGSESSAILAALAIEFDAGGANLAAGCEGFSNRAGTRHRSAERYGGGKFGAGGAAICARVIPSMCAPKAAWTIPRRLACGLCSPGDFSFSVRLTSADPNSIDTEAAHAYLLAAQKIAPPPWTKRLDPLLTRLEEKKPDTKKPNLRVPRIGLFFFQAR